ncbi:polysaccharide biosynthesis/export family protein [Actibacterium ureilyticum]|uniref:polysaccharide biosynthesis/export family protein n=1 Tax=Actibacterium ureilyticum TaxID=1590614 RepID=UPI000BAAEBC6|nr:polysaccharide biosynthesis/export family protein [Actibacterium ureilyticum]
MMRAVLVILSFLFATATAALAAGGNYTVRAGDTLSVEVLEDSSLNRNVLVLPDGQINFPFAGSVSAAGRTIGQIQGALVAGIEDQFQTTPTVVVSVVNIPLRTAPSSQSVAPATINVYLMGEVNNPGLREVTPGTSFLQLLSQGGGFTKFAATKRVQVRRRDATTGAERVYKINYRALANGAALSEDIILANGDVILVPERRLFE